MDLTYSTRKAMRSRLLDLVVAGGAAALVGPSLLGGCGGKVVIDGATAGGVGGAGGTRSTGSTGSAGIGGAGGFGGAGGASCTLTTTGTSGNEVETTECFLEPPDGCPSVYHASMYIIPQGCAYLVSVDCGPVLQGFSCCYLTREEPQQCAGSGRPFLVAGLARTASPEPCDRGWADPDLAPSAAGLDASAREALARAWTADALLEHASIASFSRFSLQLLAVGAPADLVAAAHRAALDEVRHARLCFALAAAYGGAPVAPSPFSFDGVVAVQGDLAALAAATAREGCLGETLAALVVAEALARATDPAVRRALSVIAEDEARHAELAWRTVVWAIEEGGAPVRAAVREVFGNAARHLPFGVQALSGIDAGAAAAHGRLDAPVSQRVVVRALAEVILPCADALLAGRAPARPLPQDEAGPLTQRSLC